MSQNSQPMIAIIGATGNVGRLIVESLLKRGITKPENMTLYASSASAGKQISLGGALWEIKDTDKADFSQHQICLFATDSHISKVNIPKALAKGCMVVDSSSLHRLDPAVPLIVAPINRQLVSDATKLYAMANCVSSPISMVIAPLHRAHAIKRVIASTYQSTSGAGKGPMDELLNETKAACIGETFTREHFARQIAFNIIPQIDKFMDDGFTYEEFKIIKEIQKIVSKDIAVTATSVRVPVMVGHSVSLAIEFHDDYSLESITAILASTPGVKISSDHYTTPVEARGSDDVFVGRIRRDPSTQHGLQLWICSDNLRRGASTDVVEVTEELIKQHQSVPQ